MKDGKDRGHTHVIILHFPPQDVIQINGKNLTNIQEMVLLRVNLTPESIYFPISNSDDSRIHAAQSAIEAMIQELSLQNMFLLTLIQVR